MRWFVLGLLAALLGWGHDHPPVLACAPRPGRATWWVADRGADRVLSLDRELFVQREIEVRAPVALAARERGEVWVASAAEGQRAGRHRLVRIGATGEVLAEVGLPPVAALETLECGDALALVGLGHDTEVLRIDAGGRSTHLARLPGACALALARGRALVANTGGELWSFPVEVGLGASIHRVRPGEVLGVVPGPAAGWWLLGRYDATTRLTLLDRDLRPVVERTLEFDRPRLASGLARQGVWVVDENGPSAVYVGTAGGVERRVRRLPSVAGVVAARALAGGALIAVSAGALFEVGGDGSLARAQGGFGFLVAVEPCTGALPGPER